MNTGRAHDLFAQNSDNSENCGGYNMIGRPLSHTKVSWFIELAPPIHLYDKFHQSRSGS